MRVRLPYALVSVFVVAGDGNIICKESIAAQATVSFGGKPVFLHRNIAYVLCTFIYIFYVAISHVFCVFFFILTFRMKNHKKKLKILNFRYRWKNKV